MFRGFQVQLFCFERGKSGVEGQKKKERICTFWILSCTVWIVKKVTLIVVGVCRFCFLHISVVKERLL